MSVVKDEKRNRYYISYQIKTPEGYKTRNIHKDEQGRVWPIHGEGRVTKAYVKALEPRLVELDSNYAKAHGSSVSVKELVSAFCESQRAERTKESTIEQYLSCFKNYLFPFVGEDKMAADAFSLSNIDRIKAAIAKGNAKESSMNNKYVALRKLITFARERKMVSPEAKEDALNALKPLKKTDDAFDRRNYLRNPKEDAERLFATFEKDDNEYLIPFLAMFYGAFRLGEWQGLKVMDCDFDNNLIIVRRQIDTHGRVQESVKNRRAAPVHIPAAFMAQLREYVEERKLNEDDWLFLSPYGGLISRSDARRVFNRHLEMAGLPHITLHGLRHTYATYMFEAGFDVKVVQGQLRHSSMSTTMQYYIHMTEGQENSAFNQLGLRVKKSVNECESMGNGCKSRFSKTSMESEKR